MAATRKAVKEAEARRISQIGDFKKRLGGIQELPSGLIVKIRNPGGLQSFLSSGSVPNSLMVIIQDGIKKGKGSAADVQKKVMPDGKLDEKLMSEMMTLLDAIAVKCIVEPKIWPRLTEEDVKAYNDKLIAESLSGEVELAETIEDLRREDRLYADELPDDDKQFLFQWISGGTRDLETFRSKLARGVDSLAAISGDESVAEPGNGADSR